MGRLGILISIFIAGSRLLASDVGNRYKPIRMPLDEKTVDDLNQNFTRITTLMLGDAAFDTAVAATSNISTITLNNAQLDNRYMVFVSPSWQASYSITAKTAVGFVINWSALPVTSTQTFSWILVR